MKNPTNQPGGFERSLGKRRVEMSYYPILRAPGAQGWVTLCNYSPNNWEARKHSVQHINVTWRSEGGWASKSLGQLAPGGMCTITASEIGEIVPPETLALLSLTISTLPPSSKVLPETRTFQTRVPVWRATLGLSSAVAQTSYQGEIDPFPPNGTLLTFAPFLQFGTNIQNFLVFLNLEKNPDSRLSELEIYNAEDMASTGRFNVRSNDVNIVSLDGLGFEKSDLPVVICRGMAGIPLYFSRTVDGRHMSLEHTHPPASMVVHGRRWEAQKLLKNYWFKRAVAK